LGYDVSNAAMLQNAYNVFIYPIEQLVAPSLSSTLGGALNDNLNSNQSIIPDSQPSERMESNTPVKMESEGENQFQSNQSPDQIKIESEEDDYVYVPKSMILNTYGGLDIIALGPALQRMKAQKEHYGTHQLIVAPKNLIKINFALKSGLTYHVKYALDTLLIYSAEFLLNFTECSELLDSLIDYLSDCIFQLFDRKSFKFYSYRELFEIESFCSNSLQSESLSTFNSKIQLSDGACAASLILRNCCLNAENYGYLANNHRFHTLIFKLINLPIPEEMEHYWESCKTFFTNCPPFSTLEHRKNALLILSCIGNVVKIPDQKTADIVMRVCIDFASEKDLYYVYPAIDSISKLLLSPANHSLIAESNDLIKLTKALIETLPQKGFTYDTTPNQLALWELAMLIISILVTIVQRHTLDEMLSIPGFMQTLMNLSKRPFGPPQYRPPNDILIQFAGIRERSCRTFLQCLRIKGSSKELEDQLVTRMFYAQRDQESWMVTMIANFLSECAEIA
jgi:hypothetical protein